MGKAKKTRKFAAVKKRLKKTDTRVKKNEQKMKLRKQKETESKSKLKKHISFASQLFFTYNENLKPPYKILIDTNFINFSIQNKLDIIDASMDCLFAKCIPCITDCVMAELEKLGNKYRVALRVAKDPRFKRLTCKHKGTYADDCICDRVNMHKVYIVATCDKDLRRRLRKIPGVPIMYIHQRKYAIERMPDALGDSSQYKTWSFENMIMLFIGNVGMMELWSLAIVMKSIKATDVVKQSHVLCVPRASALNVYAAKKIKRAS